MSQRARGISEHRSLVSTPSYSSAFLQTSHSSHSLVPPFQALQCLPCFSESIALFSIARYFIVSQLANLVCHHRSFCNLSPKTRIGVGVAFLAWGTIGIYISDAAEKRLGFEPTEKDREALQAVVPMLTVVEREQVGKGER